MAAGYTSHYPPRMSQLWAGNQILRKWKKCMPHQLTLRNLSPTTTKSRTAYNRQEVVRGGTF